MKKQYLVALPCFPNSKGFNHETVLVSALDNNEAALVARHLRPGRYIGEIKEVNKNLKVEFEGVLISIEDINNFCAIETLGQINQNSLKEQTDEVVIPVSRFWYKQSKESIEVIDGDTIKVHLDLTVNVAATVSIRLASINAPELDTEMGPAAKTFLQDYLSVQKNVWLKLLKHKQKDTLKKTFDRYIGFLFTEQGTCVNDIMVKTDHAVSYMIEVFDTGNEFSLKMRKAEKQRLLV
jgi:endonuclease YncB( thermonuclease family)